MAVRSFERLQSEWNRLVARGQSLAFKKGQVLFYEGHVPYGVFVVTSGNVSFQKGEARCPDVTEERFWKSRHGWVLGLDAVLGGTPCCCTTVAEEDCRAVFISKSLIYGSALWTASRRKEPQEIIRILNDRPLYRHHAQRSSLRRFRFKGGA